ncbi:MAG: VOC family protein [Sneathiellales bacterium]|nr:VOC family protein [Sneathiellales bacterium]
MTGIQAQPLIAVENVVLSSNWYSTLLSAQPLGKSVEDTHGGTYNRLMDGDRVILQLHSWDDEDHPNLAGREKATVGHGMLLWFEVEDFRMTLQRIELLDAEILKPAAQNPSSGLKEIWIRDPDGYVIVIAG